MNAVAPDEGAGDHGRLRHPGPCPGPASSSWKTSRHCSGRCGSTCGPAATTSPPRPTGRGALAVAARQPPDAVILDLGLPDVGGVEVILELRGWSRAPVIVLSGRTCSGRQDRRPGRGRGRLRHQAVLHGGTARPAAGHAPPGRVRAARVAGSGSGERVDLRGAYGGCRRPTASGRCGRPHRMAAAGDPGALTRPTGRIPQLLSGRVGAGFRERTNYLRYHMAPLSRKLEGDPAQTAPPAHRTRHGLPLPALSLRPSPLSRWIGGPFHGP